MPGSAHWSARHDSVNTYKQTPRPRPSRYIALRRRQQTVFANDRPRQAKHQDASPPSLQPSFLFTRPDFLSFFPSLVTRHVHPPFAVSLTMRPSYACSVLILVYTNNTDLYLWSLYLPHLRCAQAQLVHTFKLYCYSLCLHTLASMSPTQPLLPPHTRQIIGTGNVYKPLQF